ncbi:unnamed protein product [Boreogadus saida]
MTLWRWSPSPAYGIACEHVHCLLLAPTEFRAQGGGGWIDYGRCQVLVRVYEESGGGGGGLEGVLRPGLHGQDTRTEQGLDPRYARHQRRIKTKDASGC